LKPGMFFTVEPMINLGGYAVKVLSDGWTAVTRDRSMSAQFEHSIGVTEKWLRNLHALPQRMARAALSLTAGYLTRSRGAATFHIITAIVRGCGSALRPAAPTRCPIMNCLSCCSSWRFPSVIPSPWRRR